MTEAPKVSLKILAEIFGRYEADYVVKKSAGYPSPEDVDKKDATASGSTTEDSDKKKDKKKDKKEAPASGSTTEDKKEATASGSTTEDTNIDMSTIIAEDVKVVEHFLKLLKEKKSAMKVASKGEKVNREDKISINLVYEGATQVWRTDLGSRTTVKALMTNVLHKHGVPEDKQEIHINGEGADIAKLDRKSVLFNLMVRNNTNIVITRKP